MPKENGTLAVPFSFGYEVDTKHTTSCYLPVPVRETGE